MTSPEKKALYDLLKEVRDFQIATSKEGIRIIKIKKTLYVKDYKVLYDGTKYYLIKEGRLLATSNKKKDLITDGIIEEL